MNLNNAVLLSLKTMLSDTEVQELVRLAKQTDNLEKKWKKKLNRKEEEAIAIVLDAMAKDKDPRRLWDELDMEDFFMRHFLDVSSKGVESTQGKRLAKWNVRDVPIRIPKSSRYIRKRWDEWKRKKKLPPEIRKQVGALKKAYLDRVVSVWEQHSHDFRNGDQVTKTQIVEAVRREFGTPLPRASTIVQTETTRYYNTVRREIYDESGDITHYLFVAIRDHATTKWCKSRTGLVYKKGDPLLDKETPPIHWNCRSEMLPLSRLVPSHLRIINDPTKARRLHKCEPLPPGWNAA